MSSTDDSPDAVAEESTDRAGGLGEVVPGPLAPVWRRVEAVQSFRETHGERYVTALELLTAAVLIAGYVRWLSLYL